MSWKKTPQLQRFTLPSLMKRRGIREEIGKVLELKGLLSIGWSAAAVFMEPGIDHEEDEADKADDDENHGGWAGVP